MTWLEGEHPELERAIGSASVARRRSAMIAAADLALDAAPVDSPLVTDARDHLVKGRSPAPEKLQELDSLRDELDERYFDLKDAAERGEGDPADWMVFFSRARAVSALCFALGSNPDDAIPEAIYEALHALGSRQDAADRIRAKLEG